MKSFSFESTLYMDQDTGDLSEVNALTRQHLSSLHVPSGERWPQNEILAWDPQNSKSCLKLHV